MNPLYHFITLGEAEGRQGAPRDTIELFESTLRAQKSGAFPRLPYANIDRVHIPVHGFTPRNGVGAGLPLPPLDLIQRIGSRTVEAFTEVGAEMKQTLMRCLPADFSFDGARCLDFGCGVGRVIRHFDGEAARSEFWGCDIDGTAMRWCTENLSPPFRFFTLSEAPSLPFASESFDLVLAIGVLSQVYASWDHWAMELRRILKPDGVLIVSYAGQTPFEEMMDLPYGSAVPDFGMFIANPFMNWNMGGPMTFISPAWIQTFWGSLFDIDFIAPDALLAYQSLCVMRKPAPGPFRIKDVPILEFGTSQPFNPAARGKINARFDASRPFRDSYGIEGAGAVTVTGWIVFRDGPADRVEVRVDGAVVASEPRLLKGVAYRDWGVDSTDFSIRLDLASVAPGEHRLTLAFGGTGGTRHEMSIPLRVGVGAGAA